MEGLHLQPARVAEATDVVDVSVVIVNYNVREFLHQAIRSVFLAAGALKVEVIVVDNDSADGSVDMVRAQFPEVRVIANSENAGFSRANNQGIRISKGRHLLILNPDTILQEDTLESLVHFLDRHPDAGAVGCKILNPDGTFAPESRRAFPTPRTAFYRISGLSRLFPRSPVFGRYNMTFLPIDEIAEVDALSGSCMMVRRDALVYSPEQANGRGPDGLEHASVDAIEGGAGLFDEGFFMYGEDLDWCFRIQLAGWKIYYTPDTQIIHYKGESTKKGEMRYVRLFYGAMLKFADKHLHSRYSWVMKSAIRLAIFGRAAVSVAARATASALRPATEFAVVFLTVSILGWLITGRGDSVPPPLFFAAVAFGYAAMSSALIAAFGGYRLGRRRRLRSVWKGLGLAMIILAAVSFFVKDIAYSRLLLLLSPVVSGVLISLVRLTQGGGQSHQAKRVLLVGDRAETLRFSSLLATRPDSRISLIGYVPASVAEKPNGIAIPHLGPLRQLRDIVRIRRIDEVVFSSACLSNQDIFQLMQQLQGLSVHFRILSDGKDYVIGKSSIDDLSAVPLVDALQAVRTPRRPFARRAFEIPMAVAGLMILPGVVSLARIRSSSQRLQHLEARLRQLPEVVSGRRSLVGYDDSLDFTPPDPWQLKPGVFSVVDSMARPDAEELNLAYWFYVQHQSASMDWDIIHASIRHGGR
jgi:O-antigen biosynthesis protein